MRACARILPSLFIAVAASAAQAVGAIGLNFTGLTTADVRPLGQDIAPPDTTGTAGPLHIVQLINGAFTAYDKSTGAVAMRSSDAQFWADAGIFPGLGNLSDPRIIYDPSSQRWFASELTLESSGNRILVGRSTSADPTKGWYALSFTAGTGFADFPTLGVDADGVYLATNNYTNKFDPNLTGVSVFSIPKADLLKATPTLENMTRFDNLSAEDRGFTIQPVNYFGPSKGHGSLIAVDADELGKINRTNVLNPTGPGATLSQTTVITAMDESVPPNGRQPDGTRQLDFNNDNYLSSVHQVGDRIWAVHGTEQDGAAAIRWTVIDEKTHEIVHEGTIADPNFDFLHPSIAANEFGEVVIGYTRTGPGEGQYPSAFASIGVTIDGQVIFDEPLLLKQGLANYHKFGGDNERWGDYSQTSLDPDNPHIFWTAQEFAISQDEWGTQITQIIIPEPSMLVFVCSLFLVLQGRNSTQRRRDAETAERKN